VADRIYRLERTLSPQEGDEDDVTAGGNPIRPGPED
jgi:hypothetical protein